VNVRKEESKPPKQKKKKLSQILRAYNSEMHEIILLKFGVWGAEGGGH